MNLNYAKNLTAKNMLVRILSFIVYFIVSGFWGKLVTLFIKPVLAFLTKDYPEAEGIILYAVSAAVTFGMLSFFSLREGASDTELLRFSHFRTVLSYVVSALLFFLICSFTYYVHLNANIFEYFLTPYFFPDTVVNFLIYFPVLGYSLYDLLHEYIDLNLLFLALTIFIDVIFMSMFYKVGRSSWIKKKKRKIQEISESGTETVSNTAKIAGIVANMRNIRYIEPEKYNSQKISKISQISKGLKVPKMSRMPKEADIDIEIERMNN